MRQNSTATHAQLYWSGGGSSLGSIFAAASCAALTRAVEDSEAMKVSIL